MALTQISTAGVKDDAVTAGKIPANAVGSSELADNAVDTAAIADDAVTAAKLASSAVVTASIVDANVTTAKIADNAITNDKIAADTIQLTKIQEMATNHILGRSTSGTGNAEVLGAAQVRTILNVADGATASSGTTINNNADNRVITGSGTANTLNAETNVFIESNGRLGIGTSGPSYPLHVHSGTANSNAIFESGDTAVELEFKDTTGTSFLECRNDFRLKNSSGEMVRIDSSGRVMIGTTSTTGISAGSDDIIIGSIGDNTTRGITFATSDSAAIRWADAGDNAMGRIAYSNTTDVMTFHTSNATRLRLDSDGMKFGTDSAAANALSDYEEGTFNASYYWSGSDATGDGRYTKIGNRVFISVFEFAYNGAGLNDKDIVYISGLPFNARSEPTSVGSIVRYSGGNNQTIAAAEHCYIAQGGTQIKFDNTFNSGSGNWTVSLVYETDS